MIPYNAVEGSGFERPEAERSEEIARELTGRGVLTKLRQSAAGGRCRVRAVAVEVGGREGRSAGDVSIHVDVEVDA
jgi:23S rRNA (adenine2503-C2)-methyltransferase